jgi:hypothetical protein
MACFAEPVGHFERVLDVDAEAKGWLIQGVLSPGLERLSEDLSFFHPRHRRGGVEVSIAFPDALHVEDIGTDISERRKEPVGR